MAGDATQVQNTNETTSYVPGTKGRTRVDGVLASLAVVLTAVVELVVLGFCALLPGLCALLQHSVHVFRPLFARDLGKFCSKALSCLGWPASIHVASVCFYLPDQRQRTEVGTHMKCKDLCSEITGEC